jgi:hypothetical protein
MGFGRKPAEFVRVWLLTPFALHPYFGSWPELMAAKVIYLRSALTLEWRMGTWQLMV